MLAETISYFDIEEEAVSYASWWSHYGPQIERVISGPFKGLFMVWW